MNDVVIRRAMVLAAGFGQRLRPLSAEIPKPLIPVLGRPLLDWILCRLETVGVQHAVLNTHHLPQQIGSFLDSRPGLSSSVFHETEIQGTGGALANARRALECETDFLLHNGDVWCNADFSPLILTHVNTGPEVTLLLVDHPPINSVVLGSDGRVRDIGGRMEAASQSDDRALTYTGIAIISRRFLSRLPDGPSELAAAFLAAMKDYPDSIRGVVAPRGSWSDLGTPRSYLETHAELLATGKRIVGLERSHVDPAAKLSGFVALGEGAHVGAGVELEDCVVMAGCQLTSPGFHHRKVLGNQWSMPGWPTVSVPPPSGLDSWSTEAGFGSIADAQPLAGQASDRAFWRLSGTSGSAVLMDSRADASEFSRTVAVSRFLHDQGLGGADVLAVDKSTAVAVFEDLGDRTLQLEVQKYPERTRAIYRQVMERLFDLQQRGTGLALGGSCVEACDRVFGVDDLLAETTYFSKRFLVQENGIPADVIECLSENFRTLATVVAKQPRVLMHRDCQSTNIMLSEGNIRFVDVQGMRLGPRGYDIASLLRDPYVDLSENLVSSLLNDWADICGSNRQDARCEVILAGLQRSMQALGAYAFLSRIRGKIAFRQWIEPGVRHLNGGIKGLEACSDAKVPLTHLQSLIEKLV
jgi:mannose-1-phosphate guanylyltransferase